MGLREKFGLPFMFLLIFGGSVVYAMEGLWEDPWLMYLSPLRLLSMVPFGNIPVHFLESIVPPDGMMWVEGTVAFVIWSILFLLLRGLYYTISSAGDFSMWQLAALFFLLGIGIFVLIIIPVLDQMDIWRAAW